MEVLGTKVEVVNAESGAVEASVVRKSPMSPEDIASSVASLTSVVARAFNHYELPVQLSYVAKTDVQI